MVEEEWKIIPEFPDYLISNLGNVYNRKRHHILQTNKNNYGHLKINLVFNGKTYTRSVAFLVAQAFVEPPNYRCDHLIVLDGILENVEASNLAWRPRSVAWKYTHQLKQYQPTYILNLPVQNINTGKKYSCIMEAGINEGLLFADIWRSTYTGDRTYPYGHVFEIIEKV